MPHVYAATVHGIFYGYGYAVAQDRLFQMEMARRATQGKTAEVLGPSMVAFDKSIRGNFSPERIQRQLAAMSPEDRQILDGYAAGMNAWIARVRAEPGRLMPKEFNDLEFQPSDWTSYDVAMVYVGTMANRFSDANSEIDNLALLTALKDRHGEARAMQIFNQLRWMTDSRAPVTVPEEEGCYRPGVATSGAAARARRPCPMRCRATTARRPCWSACRAIRRAACWTARRTRCANGCWRSSPSPASRASRAGLPPAISGSSGATTPGMRAPSC